MPRTYPAGVTSWVDVECPDFELATPPGAMPRYFIAGLDGLDAAGLGEAGPSDEAPEWHTYVAVDDADAAAARIEGAGGRVLGGPTDAGEGGRSVRCADPFGVSFRLWQARRRPGVEVGRVLHVGVRLVDRRHRVRLDDPRSGVRRPLGRHYRPEYPREAG